MSGILLVDDPWLPVQSSRGLVAPPTVEDVSAVFPAYTDFWSGRPEP